MSFAGEQEGFDRPGDGAIAKEGPGEAAGSTNPRPLARAPRSVFLVDDDPVSASMYQMGLEAAGFEVSVQPDGQSLFHALDTDIPGVVVLDWQLPGMFGDEILSRLRRDFRTMMLPVIILSNFPSTMEGVVDRVFAAGALAWLEKVKTPPSALARKLEAALESTSKHP